MKKIYLIAGHSNTDPGALGNGFREADLTKEVRDLVWMNLKNSGIQAVVTDEDSKNLSGVIIDINKTVGKNDIVVDIHFNAAGPLASGAEVFVEDFKTATKFERDLATELSKEIAAILNIKDRGLKSETQSARQRLAVMRIDANVVLPEICFISSKTDIDSYQKNKHVMCKKIAEVIIKHYNKL